MTQTVCIPGFRQRWIDTGEARINVWLGGDGPPLLLLHGYPQTHLMWRKVAPRLAEHYTVVCPDLRGYGDSRPHRPGAEVEAYSKRAMAADQVEVMAQLGFERFDLAGHDRGGRVAHRLALDHRERVGKIAVLDIVPTHEVYASADRQTATAYFHWFFLIQPQPLPERLIGHDPEFWFRQLVERWAKHPEALEAPVLQEYLRHFSRPEVIHGSCQDYRAGAGVDLEHDEADMDQPLDCPLLALWAAEGFCEQRYDVLATWRARARQVSGQALPDCGHLFPEERPEAVVEALRNFFG